MVNADFQVNTIYLIYFGYSTIEYVRIYDIIQVKTIVIVG